METCKDQSQFLSLGPCAEGSHPGGEHLDSDVARLSKKVQGKELVIGLFVVINGNDGGGRFWDELDMLFRRMVFVIFSFSVSRYCVPISPPGNQERGGLCSDGALSRCFRR